MIFVKMIFVKMNFISVGPAFLSKVLPYMELNNIQPFSVDFFEFSFSLLYNSLSGNFSVVTKFF